MSNSASVTNFPDSGTPERVAYDLAMRIAYNIERGADWNRTKFLDLYVECLLATRGRRDFKDYLSQ